MNKEQGIERIGKRGERIERETFISICLEGGGKKKKKVGLRKRSVNYERDKRN